MGKHLRAVPFGRMVVLLEIGAVGYLVGAVAWSLFWLAMAWNYEGIWAGYLDYVGFFAVSLSLIVVGIGCLALGKLFSSWPAVATGVVNVIAALPIFIIGLFTLLPFPPWPFRSWHLWYITLVGYGSLIAGLLLWALTASNIARPPIFRGLRFVIGVTSLLQAAIFLLLFPALRYGPIGLTLFTQPYVLAQVLSAVLLHKISSDIQRKPHESKQA